MRLLLALALLLIASTTHARPLEVGLSLWSHHTNPEGCRDQVPGLTRCQDDTPGLYVRDVRDGTDPVAGYYKNSVGRPTWYAGAVFTPWERDRFAIEVAVAGATGYPAADVVPLVMPAVRAELGRGWATSAGVIPRIGEANPTWVIHFTLSKRFGGSR
jgi:hypothetical protein